VVRLAPARDTTVDSVGVLAIRLRATDRSAIRLAELRFLDAPFAFPALTPYDTLVEAQYPVALGQVKHQRFRYFARAVDNLDHETVTDTVTVTVR
jgi:hypothetical protein